MIICVVRIIYGNHITISNSTFNIKLLWFTVTYRCYTCYFRWYFTRFLDFFHMSNKFFRPIFEPVRHIFPVFSVCFTGWNIFLDIARTYLKQKSKGKYVMNQWILKIWFIAKTSMSSIQSFKAGMKNWKREKVFTHEILKELSGFRKYDASRWSFITFFCITVPGLE